MAEFDQVTLETSSLVQGRQQNKDIDRKHSDRVADLSRNALRPERHSHLIRQRLYDGLSRRDKEGSVAVNQ